MRKIAQPRLALGLVSGLISIGDPFTDGVTSRRYRDRANAALFEGVIDQILAAQP